MKRTIHLIGNAHIDPVWLWRWQDGFAEIKATFRSALDRMKEYPDFHFTSGCGVYYEWLEKSCPAMFRELRQRVQEGRWHIVGGWFLQPDCNLPCGESFARQGLITQRYFKDRFGRLATTGYNVDSFGHNGSLPQILRKSGMENYVFMRPQPHEKELPQSCFLWQSRDGSRVKAYRIPFTYAITTQNDHFLDRIEELAQQEERDLMAFYGVGNHGGGPTIQLLDKLHERNRGQLLFSHCERFFDAVDERTLPVVEGDLQYHAKGCYSACSQIKRDNRVSEHNLLTAEKYAVLARQLLGERYPAEKLKKAWKNVLFNQFHDTLGGCAVKEAYQDAAYLYGETMSITEQSINFALQQLSWAIDTTGNAPITGEKEDWKLWTNETVGTPVVVFNPHPWPLQVGVRLNADCKRVCTEDGRELPMQVIRGKQTNGSHDKSNALFQAQVPPMGYATYRLFLKTRGREFPSPYSCSDTCLENEFLKARFDPESKQLVSLYDKEAGRELLSGPCGVAVLDDTENDTWAHGKERYQPVLGRFTETSLELLEEGPVRWVLRQSLCYGQSSLRQDYILYANARELIVQAKAELRERHRVMKLTVPVKAEKPKAYCEIPYGYMERPTDGTEQVGGQWLCVTSEEGGGLAIANDSKYSFSVDGSVIGLTALRTAIYVDHYGQRDAHCEYMDMGEQDFAYSLHSFRSFGDTQRKAMELNVPERHIIETFHLGSLPTTLSAVACKQENVVLTAMKQAEAGDGIILRCYETENRETEAILELPLWGKAYPTHFSPSEIKTLHLSDTGDITETSLLEYCE